MWKTYLLVVILPCVIDPTYNTTRIGNTAARSSAVIIEGRSKANTLGIDIDLRWSLEAEKHVIRETKSSQIDLE